jgi:hypothetical protein
MRASPAVRARLSLRTRTKRPPTRDRLSRRSCIRMHPSSGPRCCVTVGCVASSERASEAQERISADMASVHHPGRPVEPPASVEPPEQLAMQPIPHAGRLPVAQPPPRRDARQPSSRGNTRHGTPVTSTKRMAVNAMRSSTRGRPVPRRSRSGNSGSSAAQSPSSTCSGSAIRSPSLRRSRHSRLRTRAQSPRDF